MPQPFDQLPSSLRSKARWTRLAEGRVPALLIHPHWDESLARVTAPAPVLVWMHGRTVHKELDPGRYLRLMRAGIASCALDLPGHGERADLAMQAPGRTLEVVAQMAEELDGVVAGLEAGGDHAGCRMALGGMSAGGMAALVRLTRPHTFAAVLVECTTGSWKWQQHREAFHSVQAAAMNPIDHLDRWRDIPLLALHNQLDQWISIEGQREFVGALRARSAHPERIELHEYGPTGAPFEHSGFGRLASDAKERGTRFLVAQLGEHSMEGPGALPVLPGGS